VLWLASGDAFGWPGALVRLRRRPWRALGALRYLFGARRALHRERYDEVIAHWLVPTGWPLLSGYPGTARVVVHGSDARLLLALPPRLRGHILRSLLDAGVRFRCVSNELRIALAKVDSRMEGAACVQPSSISVPEIARSVARRELDVDDNEFLAVVVGRLVSSKRVAEALTQAPVPANCRWMVIGDGPQLAELRSRFPAARFLGQQPRPETLRWIAAANVLVHASSREGAPTVIREARALGTEVWCANVGDVADWALTDPGIHVLPQLGTSG